MLEIEIDGKKLTVPQGSTVMEAAHSIGTVIPHFCYHKKLSIAANCRMCLVEVEKAPKPLPACATPVTDGMKVHTHSDMAKRAQQGVMEFLLINHPLDCPICDQGGECQLQDIAVGYGKAASRYQEEKRAVKGKEMGPLVSAEEMSRCIHCTRCVRFTEEVGGFQEIGMANRGEHSEIMPFLGQTIHSEISGNVIDLCPVGALTSKPFRYSTRAWELSRRKSISAHDGLGSNLIVQVKSDRVMRVLPLENEAINECWLSDRDRFSYLGLNSDTRLQKPMIKFDGTWHETDWETALNYVVKGLKGVLADHGKEAIEWVVSPQSTLEELYLVKALANAFETPNVDYRLRQSDVSGIDKQAGTPWLGSEIAALSKAQSVLLVGSTIRQEQPLLAARIRQAVKKGAKLALVHAADDELLCKVHAKAIVHPNAWVETLQGVLKALCQIHAQETTLPLPAGDILPTWQAIAESLSKENGHLLVGQLAQHHPAFYDIWAVASEIARISGVTLGVLGEAANSVGAGVLGLAQMQVPVFSQARKAYVVMHHEPEFDSYNPQQALKHLKGAETVIMLTAYRHAGMLDYADVLLPIAPFTETAGSFINMAGQLQSFNGVVKPLGETRPAWKVLRVLGNLLGLNGFDFNSPEDVRQAALKGVDLPAALSNQLKHLSLETATAPLAWTRLGEVGLYQGDVICRRSEPLQATDASATPKVWLNAKALVDLQCAEAETLALSQADGSVVRLQVGLDNQLADGVVRVAAGFEAVTGLGGLLDAIALKKG